VRQEETTSGAHFVEEEQFLVLQAVRQVTDKSNDNDLSNPPMISLRSLDKERFVLRKLLLVWKRDSVDSLEGIIARITKEIGRRILDGVNKILRRADEHVPW
jgi:hypothetical protein